jgi:AcrR family transcriptional regulator
MKARAQPPTSRGRDTRNRILDAARDIILRAGPTGLGMRAVAKRATMSLGNLQFHYRDRASILRGILERELALGAESAEPAVRRPEQADPIDAAIDAMLARQRAPGAGKLFFSLWAFAAASPALRKVLHEFYADWITRVSQGLCVHAPRVTAAQARQRALLFVATLEGASLFRCGVAGPWSRAQESFLRRILRGLLTGAPC